MYNVRASRTINRMEREYDSWEEVIEDLFPDWIDTCERGGWSYHGYTLFRDSTPLFSISRQGEITIHDIS